ncbi:hypothetical protein FRC01_000556 [Tulasnella sp. 417]|nr:hypothetical protein FRC01_000556 [Tulasnella sp. 417]
MSEFGEVPAPSPWFSEPSQVTPRIVSERAPSPTRPVTTVSRIPYSPSIIREILPAHPSPRPSSTSSPWEPPESGVYTSFVSEGETESKIPSISYPAAPAGSLACSPSIRSIKSPWAAETDVSFESSLLGPPPSIESASIPPTVAYEPTPVRLHLPTPTVSLETFSSPVTPDISAIPAPPQSPSTVSAATTESTVQVRNVPRPHSPPVSSRDESSVTPSEITEYRTVSSSVVSSATRSLPMEVRRPAPLLGFPPSRRRSRAPSVVSLRSFSTRASNRPSISSRLGTVVSESVPAEPEPESVVAPTRVSTEDILRLRQLFSNMDEHHESESRELASQVSQIEEELLDLSRFVRDAADQRRQRELEALNKRPEIVVIQVLAPVLAPAKMPVEPDPELELDPEPNLSPHCKGSQRARKRDMLCWVGPYIRTIFLPIIK